MGNRIIGTVTGNFATYAQIRAYHVTTGELVGSAELVTGVYDITTTTEESCILVLTPYIGIKWKARYYYAADTIIHPLDPTAIPYYYKCTQTGYSGDSEPAFVSDPLVRIEDRNCTWERVARIPPPQVHFPVTPT